MFRLVRALSTATLLSGGVAVMDLSATSIRIVDAAPVRCYSNQLTVSPYQTSGAAGHRVMQIRFGNSSMRACSLYGYPGFQLQDARGKALPTRAVWATGYFFAARPKHSVRLAPRGNAYFVIEWTHIPTPGQACPTARGLRVTPPNAFTSIQVPLVSFGIDACGGILTSTPVEEEPLQL
jgi:Protein of unknown function (DUF4232)